MLYQLDETWLSLSLSLSLSLVSVLRKVVVAFKREIFESKENRSV